MTELDDEYRGLRVDLVECVEDPDARGYGKVALHKNRAGNHEMHIHLCLREEE